MTTPKKKNGFRKIKIEGMNFNWRFNQVIDIRPELKKENILIVDFGWFDEWLYVNDTEGRPPDFEPKTVTPEFVRRAIEFALKNNWNTDLKTGLMQLKFVDGKFSTLPKPPPSPSSS